MLFEVPIDGIAFVLDLSETPDDGARAGQMVNVISATITTNFRVQVRLANSATSATGPTVLFGTLADCGQSSGTAGGCGEVDGDNHHRGDARDDDQSE